MNVKELTAIINGVAPAVLRFVQESTGPLDARIKSLEDRLTAREASLAERVQQLEDLRREVAELRGELRGRTER